MATIREWILDEAGEEKIEGVVLGAKGWGDLDDDEHPKRVVLSWDEAQPWIGYDFHDGYGEPDCHAFTAWTATKVIGVSQYDGSTRPFSMPRHPTVHTPKMPGG